MNIKTASIWANLATSNISRTRDFYKALGFSENGHHNDPDAELTSFAFGESRFIINFFRKDILQKNTQSPILDTAEGNEVVFSLSAESRADVDAWVEHVTRAGGRVCIPPYEVGPGYTVVFADPDGHKFNVLYWPGM